METISDSSVDTNSGALKSIFVAGLVAGVLDLTAACVTNHWLSPVIIFQSIAAGIYGKASYEGGAKTAILGILLHFVIAFGSATAFYFASRKIRLLINHPIVSGILYGIAVYWFMQLVVLPLSNFPSKFKFTLQSAVIGMIVHIICIGLPIAFITRRFSK
jgi:hypothetical protein